MALQDNEQIALEGNVVVTQPATENQSAIKLTTNYLTLHPKKQLADTNSKVTAISDSQTITAKGMTLDLNSETLNFHSNVVGKYVP